MAPMREILDSDEEDSDYSAAKDPVTPAPEHEPNEQGNDDLKTTRTRRAESTDPSFFRNVYDAQRRAANGQHSASSHAPDLSHELGSTLSSNTPLNLSYNNGRDDPSHLSSITDPAPASQHRQKKSGMKGVVDLTQVTTPGRSTPSAPTDIWDFPASPERGTGAPGSSITQPVATKKKISIKLKQTESKRKNPSNSGAQTPEQSNHGTSKFLPALSVTQAESALDITPSESRQKRRRISSSGDAAQNSRDVDLLIIPRSEEKSNVGNSRVTPTGGSSSIVEYSLKARSTSLLVVPNTLTTSQREEFRFVSLSSDGDRNDNQLALPPSLGQTEDIHKSSGSATIAYPTPSQYASSGRRASPPVDGSPDAACSSQPRRRQNAVNIDLPSSPDIILEPVANPPNTGRREFPKLDATHPVGNDPGLLPSARRGGREKVVADELLSPEHVVPEIGRPRSSGRIKTPSRRRAEIDLTTPSSSAAGVSDPLAFATEAQLTASHQDLGHVRFIEQLTTIEEESRPKKKRGRKRKEPQREPKIQPELETSPSGTFDKHARIDDETAVLDEQPVPKKRRGRPRKDGRSQAMVVESDSEIISPGPIEPPAVAADERNETPQPKRKRGRPKKSDVAKSAEPEDLAEGTTATANVDAEDDQTSDLSTDRHDLLGKASKKGNAKGMTEDDSSTRALSERDSNSNFGASPTKGGTPARDAVDTTAKENQIREVKGKKEAAKEETKGGITPSQLGKVQYRVGLSKRSRIAPLLKSFRK